MRRASNRPKSSVAPCAERLRYVSTGGEADMYAMRLARAFTGRDKSLKFEDGYHGMSAEARMSLTPSKLPNFPLSAPDSAGIPASVRDEVRAAPFNDIDFLRSFMAEHGNEIAGVIVEPLQRIIPPQPGFPEGLREECDRYGAVLVFDEIVTGFRFAHGGAQELYGVKPDVCTLGKVIGGGFPLAAIAGYSEIMAHFDKGRAGAENRLMQSGTLSGNPVASAAGLKTLEILRRPGAYETLRETGQSIMTMFERHLGDAGIPHRIVGDRTLFDVVFTGRPVRDYRDAMAGDGKRSTAFNDALRADGVFKSPCRVYPSMAVTESDLEWTDLAIRKATAAICA